jgi:hypothetical protein
MMAYISNSSTQEAEAGGLQDPGQHELFSKTLSLKKANSQALLAHTSNCSYSGAEIRRITVHNQPISKISNTQKRSGGMA